MNEKIWRLGILIAVMAAFTALAAYGQGGTAVPKGIIPTPPESEELQVSIWVDKGAYTVGESITIHYSVNKPAYVYIWDIEPDGTANQIFPNSFPGGSDNYAPAGEHVVPGSWQVDLPVGTEYLQILATTTPVDPFAYLTGDPDQFRQQIEVQILGIIPASERSWNFTSFEIVSGAPPSYATLTITSDPSWATITLDGTYAGYTPRTLFVEQGFHRITISKAGYQSYNAMIFILGGGSRTIDAGHLTPLFPTNNPPTASFTYYPSAPMVYSPVQFSGSGSSDTDGWIVSYAWNFGDGSTGTGPLVSHTFLYPGSYSITLRVTDDDGASSEATQTVTIGAGNIPPTPSLTISPASVFLGGWVKFDGTGSSDADGTIVSYLWDPGDGSAPVQSTVPYRFYRYANPGTYTVTLTVIDDDGSSAGASAQVQVITTNIPPEAAFTYYPESPQIGEWIRFDASGSQDPDGTIATYSWNFGDGTSPVATENTYYYYRFTSARTYLVTLTVTDNDGASDSVSYPIAVGSAAEPPVASFTYTPVNPAVGQVVTFDASSSFDPDGLIIHYIWDLDGDGNDDASGPTAHAGYGSAGVANVRLTVIDNDGLSATVTQPIAISSGWGGPSGAPPMGNTPGIFVWGTDTWHITVNAGSGWSTPHSYRIELGTDGTFQGVNRSATGGVAPLGIIPTPTGGGKSLTFEGSLQIGSIDYSFTAPGADKIRMSLKLDIDGDGTLDQSTSFVYLRYSMVHPPYAPFVIGLAEGATDLIPASDFKIGFYSTFLAGYMHVFTTTISQLESL